MNKYLLDRIIPFEVTESFRFGNTLNNVRETFKKEKLPFNQSIDPNKGCTPEIPWTFIDIFDSISLCFVKDVLFEIVLDNKFKGEIFNGLKIGINMEEAVRIDPTIRYNDDDEDYVSDNGYWIEFDTETNKISSITIYVPEACDKDKFFTYDWVKKYSGNAC